MSDATVARRYALALHQEADDQGVADQVEADVDLVRESLAASRELVRFFESPVISREKKQAVAQRLFGERVSSLMMRFLLLLIGKGREALVPVVAQKARIRNSGDRLRQSAGVIRVGAVVNDYLPGDRALARPKRLQAGLGQSVAVEVEDDRMNGLMHQGPWSTAREHSDFTRELIYHLDMERPNRSAMLSLVNEH